MVVSPDRACPQGIVRGPRLIGKEIKKYWICWVCKKAPEVSLAEVLVPLTPAVVFEEREMPHMTLCEEAGIRDGSIFFTKCKCEEM